MNLIQAHEKQEKYCSGMACAVEVLLVKIKAVHPNLYAQRSIANEATCPAYPQHTLDLLMAGVAGVGFSTTVTAATAAEVGANPIVSAGAQASSYVDVHMSTTGSAFHNAQGQSWEVRDADRVAKRMGTSVDGLAQSTAPGPRPPAKPLQQPSGGCTEATSSVANRK